MQKTPTNGSKPSETTKTARVHEVAQLVRKKISGWKKQKSNAAPPTT